MLEALVEKATGRRAATAVLVLLVGGSALFRFGPYFTVKQATSAPTLPEENITPPDALAQFLAELDESARTSYARFQLWDLLNLVLFGTTGFFVVGWLLNVTKLAATAWRRLAALPIALAIIDLAENVVLGWALHRFPETAATNQALPWVTGLKFLTVLVIFATIACLGVVALAKRLRPSL